MTDRPAGPAPTPFSRYLAIGLSFAVAIFQATRGYWFEVAGLVGLGTGLVLLRLAAPPAIGAPPRPVLRYVAVACFAVTVAAVIYVFRRDYG